MQSIIRFWSLIRPDRKALSLITMGQMHGHSGTLKKMLLLIGGGVVLSRMNDAVSAGRERAEREWQATKDEFRPDPEAAERARAHRLGYAETANPYDLPGEPDAYQMTGTDRSAPTPPPARPTRTYTPPGYDVRRPAYGTPRPPPAGSTGGEDVYRAPDRTRTERL